MADKQRAYIAIDLKSFYASVECVQRGYDPLTTNLVVADKSRTEKTICLAVSPSLKAYGISGRARLFEALQRVKEVNDERLRKAPQHFFRGKSFYDPEVKADPTLELDFVIATPQMAKYIEISAQIYETYLKYISPDDIHVYSIDEVFMDVTDYLSTYHCSAHDLAMLMIRDVLDKTGITATAGVGSNLFLCKIAMDIVAKKMPADKDGVRIAELDEYSFREQLWEHTPLTDFWRVGGGYAKKLESINLHTMGDIAEFSTTQYGRDKLFRLFGVNAELLIDHAWGYEPCTMRAIKEYGAERKSLGAGQVLKEPYEYTKARLVTREMADALSLDLAARHLVTDQIVLTIGYDRASLEDKKIAKDYKGKVSMDWYGRRVPSHAHGTINLSRQTASTAMITKAAMELFERIVDPRLLIRRINITAGKITKEAQARVPMHEQFDLFSPIEEQLEALEKEEAALAQEKKLQDAVLAIQKRYGKNSLVKGMNMQEGATMMERNGQIGGHKA
ncbi:MAG: DNA methylase [Oscillospiraceae bacterium]|nr:DNA methylase [Oscillospiraceae bacterium]